MTGVVQLSSVFPDVSESRFSLSRDDRRREAFADYNLIRSPLRYPVPRSYEDVEGGPRPSSFIARSAGRASQQSSVRSSRSPRTVRPPTEPRAGVRDPDANIDHADEDDESREDDDGDFEVQVATSTDGTPCSTPPDPAEGWRRSTLSLRFSQPFVTSFMATASGLNFSVAEGPEPVGSAERWARRRAQRRAQWQAEALQESSESSMSIQQLLSPKGESSHVSSGAEAESRLEPFLPEATGRRSPSVFGDDDARSPSPAGRDGDEEPHQPPTYPAWRSGSWLPQLSPQHLDFRITPDERLPLPGGTPALLFARNAEQRSHSDYMWPIRVTRVPASENPMLPTRIGYAQAPSFTTAARVSPAALSASAVQPAAGVPGRPAAWKMSRSAFGVYRPPKKSLDRYPLPLFPGIFSQKSYSQRPSRQPLRKAPMPGADKAPAPSADKLASIERLVGRQQARPLVRRGLGWVLIWMLAIAFLCNFDHGAIPACLNDIAQGMQLSFIEQSLLGSFVYLGLIGGTVIGGALLQRVLAKKLLLGSLVLLSVSVLGLSLFSQLWILYLARFCSGIAQAIPTVYLPVWVDEFAPRGSTAQWISFTQLASIFGTVFGYFVGGALTRLTPAGPSTLSRRYRFPWQHVEKHISNLWHLPFIIQAALILPVFIALVFSDPSYVSVNLAQDTRGSDGSADVRDRKSHIKSYVHNKTRVSRREGRYSLAGTEAGFPSLLSSRPVASQIKILATQPLYILTTLAMSNLYFIVTGMQFWVTQYLVDGLHNNKLTVVSTTTFCFLTSPTLGVYVGGLICDLSGGYKKSKQRKAMLLVTCFAGIASLCAMMAVFVTQFVLFVTLIWLCLFSGAAIVPICIGLIMSSTPASLRSLSSALSQIVNNVFGWFAGPLLPGAVMDILTAAGMESPQPLLWGFRFILVSSLGGFLCFFIAIFVT